MNISDIKELARLMQETGLTSLKLTEGALNIELERGKAAPAAVVAAPSEPVYSAEPVIETKEVQPKTIGEEIRSPMVGVFYAAASPEAKPYVEIGSKVKKGDVICIIEAMKLMNEITAEQDGEIVDICVKNGEVVEYSQPLFRIA